MAEKLTKEKLLDFLARLGASARTPGACFITGGGSAILLGWRETTIDVDLKFDPEPAGDADVPHRFGDRQRRLHLLESPGVAPLPKRYRAAWLLARSSSNQVIIPSVP